MEDDSVVLNCDVCVTLMLVNHYSVVSVYVFHLLLMLCCIEEFVYDNCLYTLWCVGGDRGCTPRFRGR